MTEDEAKMKWCPHVVASHTDPRQAPSHYEREAGVTSPFRHNCIASACMAWRKDKFDVDTSRAKALVSTSKVDAIKALREVVPSLGLKEAKDIIDGARPWPVVGGYCGLAGTPAA